jgi:gamma-glutamylcyclotransferase
LHRPRAAGTAISVTPLWYFAYGSNLCRATFVERRGMQPLAAVPARLDGFRLTFDLPVGPGERGVANLLADPAASVWGVCYQLEPAACDALDRTEGVHLGYYGRHAVETEALDGRRLPAFAYLGERRVAGRKPSARYLGLILAGAREHGLPPHWIATLERLELAVDERLTQKA